MDEDVGQDDFIGQFSIPVPVPRPASASPSLQPPLWRHVGPGRSRAAGAAADPPRVPARAPARRVQRPDPPGGRPLPVRAPLPSPPLNPKPSQGTPGPAAARRSPRLRPLAARHFSRRGAAGSGWTRPRTARRSWRRCRAPRAPKAATRKSSVPDTSMGPNTGMLSGVPSRLASHTSASSSRSEAAKII